VRHSVCALAFVLLAGCSSAKSVQWTRIDGAACQTTHVNAVWFEGDTATTCMVNGKAEPMQTTHSDLGQLGYLPATLMSAVAMLVAAI
jgi:hypothetical protein